MLVDANPHRTLLTLLEHGSPVFARSLAYGVPPDEAALAMYASRLGKQLQHTLYACENVLQRPYEPDLLLLSGPDREPLSHLTKILQEATGTPVQSWQITASGYKPGHSNAVLTEPTRYAVAFGAALRGLHRQTSGLNLRREQFALHRDLQELRGRLVVLGVLLVGVLGLGLCSLYLDRHYKLQRYTQIQSEMARVFRVTLPDTRMVQPTLQMREKIRELDEHLKTFGGITGAQMSGLQILQEISARVPPSLVVNVDNLTIATDTVDLNGSTVSFDDVEKLREALEATPSLFRVSIENTKKDADKVTFKLSIKTVKALENTP
jgi:Tfp pilus assembly protein PilN